MISPQHILVTGGTGFTGGHLARRLVADGHAVRVLVRTAEQAENLRAGGMEPVLGDLRDAASLQRAALGVDTVYHCAALFRAADASRREMWDVNVEGTRNLLEAALRAGTSRFVHLSTIGVHGDIRHPPATEDAPYAPGDAYQESKVAGEQLVLEYLHGGRLPIVVIRPGGIYGPGDLRFLKLFRGIQRGTFVMLGRGEVLYQMIYIDDLVDGIVLCGTAEAALGKVYILTGEPPVTLNELADLIARVLGVRRLRLRIPVTPVYLASFACDFLCRSIGLKPPIYPRRVDFFRKSRCFDISRAKGELGFVPRTELEAGLRRTADWYRGMGYLRGKPALEAVGDGKAVAPRMKERGT